MYCGVPHMRCGYFRYGLYSGALLSDRNQIYPSDMTGGLTVFREVDRSVEKIKFHLKSYLIPDRKTGINSNNVPKLEVRNLCFETLSV